jgi:uncharacterized membrane protein YcaP (DUF421 family)
MDAQLVAAVFSQVDWREVLLPDTPIVEIFVRGTVIYLAVLVLLRVFNKREAGSLGITDLIVIVFLADAAQNAMAGDYKSVPDGIILMFVIVGWAFALDRLAYHVPFLDRLMRPAPVTLIRDGRVDRRALRREAITQDELLGELRLQGVEDTSEVRLAKMEQDGRISVIKREAQGSGGQGQAQKKGAA